MAFYNRYQTVLGSSPVQLLQTARPPFLLLAPTCILLGWATAARFGLTWSWIDAWLAMLGALAAHAAVNIINEYQDFQSGLDSTTERTPFSGGSGYLPAHPKSAPAVLVLGLATVALMLVLMGWFLWRTQMAVAPLVLVGLILVLGYTRWLTRSVIFCLIAPGAGFGLLVLGSHRVIGGNYPLEAVLLTLVVFFLVNNLLLLNQFPDVDADRAAGRRHLLIRYGYGVGARVFLWQMLAAYGLLLAGVLLTFLPPIALSGMFTAPVAFWCAHQVSRYAAQPERLGKAMAGNVAVSLLTPLLLAGGLCLWP
ncbi:prenyltransferase [Marinimicrobium sp. C2-29]|uniref:prenyltransferase n=1 Tax=Marinimicrobium sp. C2-29 TaxID=3139825 RepID=UPI00313A4B7F